MNYNSYDGHTLNEALEQAERLGDFEAKEVYVNRGYRAHDYEGSVKVHLARLRNEKGEAIVEALVETSVGNRTGDRSYENRWVVKNYLLGVEGDRINAILCGAGHNIRKLLRAFLLFLFWRLLKTRFQPIAD